MRVLVTGGAGYIGSHTCLVLLQAGHEVEVVDNLSNSKEESLRRVRALTGKPLAFHKVDLLDTDALDHVFQRASPDAVLHFAGLKADRTLWMTIGTTTLCPARLPGVSEADQAQRLTLGRRGHEWAGVKEHSRSCLDSNSLAGPSGEAYR